MKELRTVLCVCSTFMLFATGCVVVTDDEQIDDVQVVTLDAPKPGYLRTPKG